MSFPFPFSSPYTFPPWRPLAFFIASCFSILGRPTGLPFPQLPLFILSPRTTSCVFFTICFWFTVALTRNFFGQCPRRSFNESESDANFRRPDVTSAKNTMNSISVNFLISIAHGLWIAEKLWNLRLSYETIAFAIIAGSLVSIFLFFPTFFLPYYLIELYCGNRRKWIARNKKKLTFVTTQ